LLVTEILNLGFIFPSELSEIFLLSLSEYGVKGSSVPIIKLFLFLKFEFIFAFSSWASKNFSKFELFCLICFSKNLKILLNFNFLIYIGISAYTFFLVN